MKTAIKKSKGDLNKDRTITLVIGVKALVNILALMDIDKIKIIDSKDDETTITIKK